METTTTRGIKVSVETFYQEKHSSPVNHKFVFIYRITIENKSPSTVQLLRRHWHILDSNGVEREVEGEGVIGKQPILKPGESHQYVSWTPLQTDIGKMHGSYLMQEEGSKIMFRATVPVFTLIAPFKEN